MQTGLIVSNNPAMIGIGVRVTAVTEINDVAHQSQAGPLELSGGGARLVAGGEVLVDAAETEYRGLYGRFVELTATEASDVDLTPLRLVADAFMLGRRQIVEAFED